MEVVRDSKDNCIIVCSIENFDPMGVHTGDSITVAPAQTLTDKEYQLLRNASIAVLREIGVDTGGSNVQFAIHPDTGRMVVIEMNPRVSRSSALASKATGFPIAKVAAKLAVGYTLDELENDITGGVTPASFEPSLDYVVTKIPRFTFEKFEQADPRLTTQMKSVGEVMAIGRTFQESLQKACRGLETGRTGLDPLLATSTPRQVRSILRRELRAAGADRLWYIADAFRAGWSLEEIQGQTAIDPWFLAEIEDLVATERELAGQSLDSLDAARFYELKRKGFSDSRLGALLGTGEEEARRARLAFGIRPVYRRVDTCAAEFPAASAYMYSTYEQECEADPSDKRKIMVLGGGPNRVGQGIEFDYCCVHAALAMREDGYETIMVNCNPETVFHRLRYLRQAVLRAGHPRGCAGDRRGGAAERRHRPVRRADSPEAGGSTGEGGRAHHRHQRGCNRPGRGPRALPGTAADARPETAVEPHRHRHRRRCGGRRRDRLSDRRAAVLCTGRARHGDRLQRGRAGPLPARRRRCLQRLAGTARPLSRPGRRGGRRCGGAMAGRC